MAGGAHGSPLCTTGPGLLEKDHCFVVLRQAGPTALTQKEVVLRVAGVQRGRAEEGGEQCGEDRGMARSGGKVPNSPPKAETGYAHWAAPLSVLGLRLKEASDTAALPWSAQRLL